uniref:NADH-ubiquinone oxidoreductase chain 2 n=1 Tax=Tanystylum sp. JZ-2022 TaxID=2992008 RepID=A0A9E7V8A3_9CHEL|nr:NADH dehydrogenase subunit 2 [Tanystylum sp. JZ-2022]
MKFNKMMMMLTLITIILWGMSSTSWFTIWITLEMSMMMMIPLMMINPNQQHTESSMKYFLIQAISSTSFITLTFLMTFNLNIITINGINTFILFIIMMKIGMVPFFSWYIEILSKSSNLSMKLIMTIQKILPINIISFFINSSKMSMTIIALNALLMPIMGINQILIKKIMIFSSITAMSWMLISSMISLNLFLMFIMIYTNLMTLILDFMNLHKIKTLNQMFNLKNLIMNLNIISLAGIPPFSSFILKWILLEMMMKFNMIFLAISMIISSLISMYFYLRMMIHSMMISFTKMKWLTFKMQTIKPMMMMKSMLNFLLIPLMSMFT